MKFKDFLIENSENIQIILDNIIFKQNQQIAQIEHVLRDVNVEVSTSKIKNMLIIKTNSVDLTHVIQYLNNVKPKTHNWYIS